MNERKIQLTASIINALKQMDDEHVKVLLVMDGKQFVGLLTIGDIQRAILRNVSTDMCIKTILDSNKEYSFLSDSKEVIKKKMMSLRAEIMPVVDSEGNLVKIYSWDDFFSENERVISKYNLKLPVVIMAGGKGKRLQPLTNIYPKPLIPVGEKTIIESIMDKFVSYGCNRFYISVNYKADIIKNYFYLLHNSQYDITYFQEDKPMGTAGSLRLLKNKLHSTFFVSNCDILIDENYADILEYHRNNENELTVVAALKTYFIPYGTIVTKENGLLESIVEKPNLTFKINTGLYILEPTVLESIPNDFFHITQLMQKLQEQGRRVGVYPISQNDWIDMGDWDEYLKLIHK